MTRAWEIKRQTKSDMSTALKMAWSEVKNMKEDTMSVCLLKIEERMFGEDFYELENEAKRIFKNIMNSFWSIEDYCNDDDEFFIIEEARVYFDEDKMRDLLSKKILEADSQADGFILDSIFRDSHYDLFTKEVVLGLKNLEMEDGTFPNSIAIKITRDYIESLVK